MCSQSADTCFAAVHSKAKGSKDRSLLLQWSYSQHTGPIEEIAHQTFLPSAVHSLHILPPISTSASASTAAAVVVVVYQNAAVALEPAVSNGQSLSAAPTDLTVEAAASDQKFVAVLLSRAAEPAIQLHAIRVRLTLLSSLP